MDKSWMKLPRNLPEYRKGVNAFIAVARNHTDGLNRTHCPCKKCKNREYKLIEDVKSDLLDNGIFKSYTCWIHHGEDFEVISDGDDDDDDDDGGNSGACYDGLQDMLDDLQAPTHTNDHMPNTMDCETTQGPHPNVNEGSPEFDKLLNEARQPLFPDCEVSKLDFLVKLLHIKTINRWSNKSYNMVLRLIKTTLGAKGESLPNSYYEAKTLMRNLGLGYISIHACKNDCVLFWKENKTLDICPKCSEPRYKILEGKGKKIPEKVLRYFPLKPRLQRLFMSRMTAEDMRWHKEKRAREDGVFRHPADSQVWETFDKDYEWFSNDCRNVRLGLASDGFNPFGNMSNAYSMWPVLLVPYNLPPWRCMKEPFIFLSLLIPGPKAPGNDIDVYLQPLIEDLKELWYNGVETYDAVTKQNFQMHAALLWTINDFPAFGNLSGWMTKGKLACPTCNKDTCFLYLVNSRKLCYMNHIRFLPPRHPLKRQRTHVSMENDSRSRPKNMSGDDLLSQLEYIGENNYGKSQKKRKRTPIELNWTKKSIFFDLPYWRTLGLRHNLDVMHIEKNICESVLGTILKLDGKTKDSAKARLDLEALGIRQELHLVPKGNKFIVPHAPYTLSPADKKVFCEWLKSVKFPDGYASNISRCVNTNDGKISGMKSHDCHVLLQRLLPVAVRGFLSKDISSALIELGIFFKELCCKTLRLEVLEKMERDIAVILCKLEQIFPPSFFDVMVHLAVHLPREAILGGPVHYRWMYPIERYLHTLKQYVRNKARLEGSIAEAYIDSECLTFCSLYLQGIETRFNRKERNYDGGQTKTLTGFQVFSQNVRPLGAYKLITMDSKDIEKVRYYVLNNSNEISEYFDEHTTKLKSQSSCNIQARQEKEFATWFEHRIQELRKEESPKVTDDLYSLACGPDHRVKRYSGCVVNGIRFHTKDRETRLRTQNSGVVVVGEHQSKDIDFYGILTDIIVLDYFYGNQVFLFKCDWWDVGNKRTGIHIDGHFTSVNISKTWYQDDRFVLASQASQVFYVSDTKLRGNWKVVQKVKPRNVYDVLVMEEEVEGQNDNEAYQQEEHVAMNGIIQDEPIEELGEGDIQNEDVIQTMRTKVLVPDEIDMSEVLAAKERYQLEDDFIDDDEIGDEDDTLMDYCSEQENTLSSDDDTDIE